MSSVGALPSGIGRSGMVCLKELDLCYNFYFFGFEIHKKVKDMMSNVHAETTIGFQESEVPPIAEINPLGHFQAEVDGGTYFIRKSAISPTTFILTSNVSKSQSRDG